MGGGHIRLKSASADQAIDSIAIAMTLSEPATFFN
jgi:hypothetical protein